MRPKILKRKSPYKNEEKWAWIDKKNTRLSIEWTQQTQCGENTKKASQNKIYEKQPVSHTPTKAEKKMNFYVYVCNLQMYWLTFSQEEKCETCSEANVDRWIWVLCTTVYPYEFRLMFQYIYKHIHTHIYFVVLVMRDQHQNGKENLSTLRALVRFLWKQLSAYGEIRHSFRVGWCRFFFPRKNGESVVVVVVAARAIRRDHRRKGQMKYFKCVVFIKGRRYNLSRLAHIWDTFAIVEDVVVSKSVRVRLFAVNFTRKKNNEIFFLSFCICDSEHFLV